MKKCIILANGKPPGKDIFKFLNKKDYKTIICADGGANSIRKLSIKPDYIIGDLDSITPANLKYFSKKTVIRKISRQNDTDVEKCIKFALSKGVEECFLLGVTGNRLDHSFCNLGIILKFSNMLKLHIISEESVLSVYEGHCEIKTLPNETISLYGFDDKTLISSKGLKYKLNKTKLPFGKKESTSNVSVAEKVCLEIENGKIFVIRNYKTIKKYDLI